MDSQNNGIALNGSSTDGSALIFLGTGCSSAIPNIMCLIQPSDPPCHVCSQALFIPPDQNPNYRCNTSLLIDYCPGGDGRHSYILIDVGKTFREQVLRWFTYHKIPRVDSIILTHEHADAVLGLDDVRAVQPFSPINAIDPTPIFLSEHAMESIAVKFPYLVQKKLKEGQEIRRVAQLDWTIIEEDCQKPFVASGLQIFPLPSLEAVKRLWPKRALLIGMTHELDHYKDGEYLEEWSKREGIPVQFAHDGLRVPVEL
ncbi:Putative hydrolase C777.06c [Linum perenne]